MLSNWWRLVAGVGLIAGIGEVIDSFFIGWGAIAALVVAALFFIGVALTVRGRSAGPVLVGVMCLVEIGFFPTLERHTMGDWVVQVFYLGLSGIGIIAAVAALLERRRAPASVV
jgi:hypothetical protein